MRRINYTLLMAGLILSAVAMAESPKLSPLKQSKEKIRVAAVQLDAQGTAQEVLAVLAPHVERAGAEQADLIVFPEYVLGSFKIPDATTDGLCALAKKHNINVIAGGWEFLDEHPVAWPPEPGTYANSGLVIDRQGNIVGKHHKMYAAIGYGSPYFWPPYPGELGENTMRLGGPSPVIDLDFGRVAVLTCYDGYFFHSFESPALRGAEVLVWINGRGGSVEDHIVRTASFMTCSHIVATNQSVGAGTMVCSYPGIIEDIATNAGDAYISGELDLAALRIQRRNNRMFHQRRPELMEPLAQSWQPWQVYEDIPLFEHPAKE